MFTVTIFQFFWRHLKNTIQKTSSSLSWMKPNVLNTLSVLTSTYQSFCTKVHQGFIFKYQVILCRKVLQVIIFTDNETCRCSFAVVLQYFGATWKLKSHGLVQSCIYWFLSLWFPVLLFLSFKTFWHHLHAVFPVVRNYCIEA